MKKYVKIHGDVSILETILEGANIASKSITSTMGPNGKLVAISSSRFTKDGATVAKNILELENYLLSIGSKLVCSASEKMGESVGDGSTTVVSILQGLMHESMKLLRGGYSIVRISQALDVLSHRVREYVKSISRQINSGGEEMAQIATIAANNDYEIGKILSECFSELGKNGVITVEESKDGKNSKTIINGFSCDRGVDSPLFFRDKEVVKSQIELDNAKIILFDKKVSFPNPQLLELIAKLSQKGHAILIIAEDFDSQILDILIANRRYGSINAVCVKAPGFGDRRSDNIKDLSIFCGTNLESLDNNLLEDNIGGADKIKISKDKVIIVRGHGNNESINKRVEELKNKLIESSSDYEKEKITERIAKLTSGIGRFDVGGDTEAEIKERKDRVEDAVRSCSNALKDGVVPGSGFEGLYCYYKIQQEECTVCSAKNNELIGITDGERKMIDEMTKRLSESLKMPFRQIISNSDITSPEVALEKVMNSLKEGKFGLGINSINGEFVDLGKIGILNPASILSEAIRIASSVCKNFIKTQGVLETIDTNTSKEPQSPMTDF